MTDSVPTRVLEDYGLGDAVVVPIPGGLINPTFRADVGGQPRAVLQKLHPIFAPEVNQDIFAITEHLAARGLETPRVQKTRNGGLFTSIGGHTWRALSFVPGLTTHRLKSPAQADSAGRLVARFHEAVADMSHTFAFQRAGVHDTALHLSRLAECATESRDSVDAEARTLATEILDAARGIPMLPAEPRRICHGDLKVSNIRFAEDGTTARCLIDLDTLSHMTIGYEMGDALRSWCNPLGEDQTEPEIDLELCRAALGGYGAGFGTRLENEERRSIADGLETVCVELAARFCRDVFEDKYFGWDQSRFGSRKEHNLLRARGQLALGLSARRHRAEIRALV